MFWQKNSFSCTYWLCEEKINFCADISYCRLQGYQSLHQDWRFTKRGPKLNQAMWQQKNRRKSRNVRKNWIQGQRSGQAGNVGQNKYWMSWRPIASPNSYPHPHLPHTLWLQENYQILPHFYNQILPNKYFRPKLLQHIGELWVYIWKYWSLIESKIAKSKCYKSRLTPEN